MKAEPALSHVPSEFTLKVQHRDGWWVITSDDVPGLVVAHQTMDAAFGDVGLSIRTLTRLNAGVEMFQPVGSLLKSAGKPKGKKK